MEFQKTKMEISTEFVNNLTENKFFDKIFKHTKFFELEINKHNI